jgi:hypothetical protein
MLIYGIAGLSDSARINSRRVFGESRTEGTASVMLDISSYDSKELWNDIAQYRKPFLKLEPLPLL